MEAKCFGSPASRLVNIASILVVMFVCTGGLRSRLMWSWKGRLNRIDAMSWGVSTEELQLLADNVDTAVQEQVWVGSDVLYGENDMGALPSLVEEESNSQILQEDSIEASTGRSGSYVSTFMDDDELNRLRLAQRAALSKQQNRRPSGGHLATPRPGASTFRRGSGSSSTSFSFDEVASPAVGHEEAVSMPLDLPSIPGSHDLRTVTFSQAMALVLKLVRILSITGGNVLLMGNTGNAAQIGIHLAATMCDMKLMSFDCKGSCADVDTIPCEDSFMSLDFKRFLKLTVLTACGFRRADTQHFSYRHKPAADGDEASSFQSTKHAVYESFTPQRVLLVVNSGQLMSSSDRQRLMSAVYSHNPCELFTEVELEGDNCDRRC
jgi:hypothetical protein